MQEKIQQLINKWEENNVYRSDLNTSDVNYLQIVNLGKEAVPYLIKLIGTSWVPILALYDIVEDSPEIKEEDQGYFNKINQAWVRMGKN